MQGNIYVYVMGATACIVLLNFFYALRVKTDIGRMICGILFSALLILVSYIPALFAGNSRAAGVFYSIYFAANTLISLFGCLFSGVYLKRKKLPVWGTVILAAVIAADFISLMLNPVFHHEVVYRITYSGGIQSRIFRPLPVFYLHLAVCYVLLGVFFVNFFIEFIRSPILYKMQYAVILLISLVCVAGNAVFLVVRFDVDISVIFYGFMAILLYYFTFAFLPRKLTQDMGHIVLREMNAAVLFYDLNGHCIYRNVCASACFPPSGESDSLAVFRKYLGIEFGKDREKLTASLERNGERRLYHVNYQQLNDARKRYMGCFMILEDVTEETKQEEMRKFLTTHDTLTGIYNQAAFYAEARDMINRHPDKQYCIITTNIKQFKVLNDFLGKETCDNLLKSVSKVLMQLRRDDIVFGRLESDHFAICAPEEYHLEEEFPVKFDLVHSFDEFPAAVVMYFGVYRVSDLALPVSSMCDRANMALASVKNDASIRVAWYDEKLREELIRENQISAQMPDALQNREFRLYYQIQIDSRTEEIVGAEALVRWQTPAGVQLPGTFIPFLEKEGLVYDLDQYVWDQACRDIVELRNDGFSVPLSVNISKRDFYSGDIPADFSALVRKYGIAPSDLNLEITESAMMLDVRRLRGIVDSLQKSGFSVEMDDFGSGSSSLNSLKDMPVNVLKMDMLFLDVAQDEERSRKIIRLVIDLAKSLGVPVIAEGVSTKKQVDGLNAIGCHNIQGYYYSRPVPFEEFKAQLKTRSTGTLE